MEQAPGHTDGPPLKSAILHFCKISSLFLSLPISRNGRLQNGQYFNGRIGWEHKVQTFQQKRKYILDTPISPFSFRHELIFNALGMSPVYLNCTCTSKILKLKCANYKCKSYPSSNQIKSVQRIGRYSQLTANACAIPMLIHMTNTPRQTLSASLSFQ